MGKLQQSHEKTALTHWQLVDVVASLATTSLAYDFAGQAVTAGVARGRDHVNTLAAYILARQLILWLNSLSSPMENVGLMLVTSQQARRRIIKYLIWIAILHSCLVLSIVATPLGNWILEGVHRTPKEIADTTRWALVGMAPYPILDACVRFTRGALIKHGQNTRIVWISSVADFTTQWIVVLFLLHYPVGEPIFLPIAACIIGASAHLVVLLYGYRTYVHGKLPSISDNGSNASFSEFVKFAWPLAVVQFAQRSSRPMVNLFVSRQAGGAVGLAALSVVYPMAHLGYGWLNQTRSLLPTYCADPTQLTALSSRVKFVMRFMLMCGLASFTYQATILFTPLKDVILDQIIGVTPEVAAACHGPLLIFAFLAWPVCLRALAHGWLTASKATKSMASSAVFRVGAVVAGLAVYPQLFPNGAPATLGVLALLTGFTCEALYVGSSALRIRRQRLATDMEAPRE
eukprot:TRINITY_DN7444_c0_g1_i1.p1 TRINITY_DN7444_c0_g1~~TRINITY_DN7444_c0_g1_i1.p1  ORF type:complete len:460 (+),score=54.44 TRINITY_DN7444_c0_g1_i1:67-1446(+)